MKVKVIAVGNLKEIYWKNGCEEYIKRLKGYCKIEMIEVKEEKCLQVNDSLILSVKEKEGVRILEKIQKEDYVILLDLEGINYESIAFARAIDLKMSEGFSSFVFVIGGSYGVSDEVKKRSQLKWSLSNMTFPHQMVRLIVLEVLYRVHKILNGEIYHK